jgi:hypothetical protein
MGNRIKKAILLIPVMIMFSCWDITPGASIKQDASRCPACPRCDSQSADTCTEDKVEKCIENCIKDNNCFLWGRSCIKNCAYNCLDNLKCDWRN